MENIRAKTLLKKYNDGNCTSEEKELVETWFLEATKNIEDPLPEPDYDALKGELWDKILKERKKSAIKQIWPRIAAAASIIISLSAGGYYLHQRSISPAYIAVNNTQDIAPGGNKAILTLANGKQIILADAKTGELAEQPGASVSKTKNGEVVYKKEINLVAASIAYNTITTPRGGSYHLTLADGTGVWLNAASSIRYPTSFSGSERVVTITGEGYFEVIHDVSRPFNVKVKGQIIEDLGTHFNINAYDDEKSLKTTLLEGKISVTNNVSSVTLKPGQQAVFSSDYTAIKTIYNVNTDQAIAWHRGLFEFHDADIQTVMRQLARWYDVDVSYEGKPTDRLFSGKIYRNITALKVSDILSDSNIHFRIEGRKIIVMP